jgi:hypothetical protein
MSILSSLKIVTSKKSKGLPPLIQRRNKLSNRLYEQIQLAQAQKEGRIYAPAHLKNVVDKETGERKTVERTKRVREWWHINDAGKINIVVKYGSKQIELGKGKNAVEVSSGDELIKVLEILKSAVEAGELDSQIETASGSLRAGFVK